MYLRAAPRTRPSLFAGLEPAAKSRIRKKTPFPALAPPFVMGFWLCALNVSVIESRIKFQGPCRRATLTSHDETTLSLSLSLSLSLPLPLSLSLSLPSNGRPSALAISGTPRTYRFGASSGEGTRGLNTGRGGEEEEELGIKKSWRITSFNGLAALSYLAGEGDE